MAVTIYYPIRKVLSDESKCGNGWWQRQWLQWLFTISIWVRARLKPIRGTMANPSWQNDPDGSLPAEFILTTMQKSGQFSLTNGVISGAMWDDTVRCCLNQFGRRQKDFSLGQIFIFCFCFSSMKWLSTRSRQTRTRISQSHSRGHGYLAALSLIKSPERTVLQSSKNALLLMPSEVSQHN